MAKVLDLWFWGGGNHREMPLLSHHVREYPKSTEHHSQEISLDIYTVFKMLEHCHVFLTWFPPFLTPRIPTEPLFKGTQHRCVTINHTPPFGGVASFPMKVLSLFHDPFRGTAPRLLFMAPQTPLAYDRVSVLGCLHDLDSLEQWPRNPKHVPQSGFV